MQLTTLNVGLIVAAAGKLFIMAADAMPSPPDNANYFWRWAYDFMQKAASNSAKVGSTTLFPLTQPQPVPPPEPVKQEMTEPKKG
jgi:hypothetical protein